MRFGPLANESDNYRKARQELLAAEIKLRDQREQVAALRRKLPLDPIVKGYVFEEGPAELDQDGPIRPICISATRQASSRLVLARSRDPLTAP